MEIIDDTHEDNWVFQTRNDWGTSRPCLFPPMAVKSKPPAVRVVVDSQKDNSCSSNLGLCVFTSVKQRTKAKA